MSLTCRPICSRLASMRNVSVCTKTHVFYRAGIFSSLFVHIFPIVAYQRSFGVLKSGVKFQYCLSLFSCNLSRSQTAFRHSNTWRNRLTLHNLLSSESFSSIHHFCTNELELILKKKFCSPHPSPPICLISDNPHCGIVISMPYDLES